MQDLINVPHIRRYDKAGWLKPARLSLCRLAGHLVLVLGEIADAGAAVDGPSPDLQYDGQHIAVHQTTGRVLDSYLPRHYGDIPPKLSHSWLLLTLDRDWR
jgi:hypothetical protein